MAPIITPRTEYPITLIEDFDLPKIKRGRKISLVFSLISMAMLIYGLVERQNLILIIGIIALFTGVISFFSLDNLLDTTILTIDEMGIKVESRRNEAKRIVLDWDSITGIHHAWQSPLADAQKFNRLFSGNAGQIPISAHERREGATVTISYKLPKRPEWREGREFREYQFSQTFGMPLQSFFDFLCSHFERNKRG